MSFIPRPYQNEAITKGIDFLTDKNRQTHEVMVLPTGSGKSICIAGIVSKLPGKTIALQPSVEILFQNFRKFTSTGLRASIYSASAGQKRVDKVTFATIGSIAGKHHLFQDFDNIIIDEAHCVNPEEGRYQSFISDIAQAKVLALTATPYRLTTESYGPTLAFLTRTRPRIFTDVLYYVQNEMLFNEGHLAKLEYYPFEVIDRRLLVMNASGTDFTEASLKKLYKEINMPAITIRYANSILKKRKNLLVFCASIEEAKIVCNAIHGAAMVTGQTDAATRDRILNNFKANKIVCLINVGVVVTGFDKPDLEAELIARSTMSLSWYYQAVGRVMRIHPNKKSAWIVDLGGNIKFFGKVEDLKIVNNKGQYAVMTGSKQLTNVPLSKL